LLFLHGLSVHFGMVVPAAFCDVILIAPHAPGRAVREKYLTDRSLSAFYAVGQDFTGHARRTALELARAIGFKPQRLIATTFEHEAVGDLFGEQAVLCGGLAALIKNGFEVLVEKGIPAENAYLEVAYQLDLIVQLLKEHGIEGMLRRISVAARYGSARAGPRIIDRTVRDRMKEVADEIITGKFSRGLAKLSGADIIKLNRSLKKLTDPRLEKAARKFNR
ncbi:MAG: ketol-acid reductoisomerase, partial [candidate division Zixibacteria bacterium]|nr:ketol-acid reductoisomerase [candidate division Zixibacteria bacterium]